MNLRYVLLAIALIGCSSGLQLAGPQPVGARVDQPGVSFTLPPGTSWSVMVRSTYQVTLGARGPAKDETFVTHANVYQLPSGLSREQFLEHVKKGRADEPRTGRFEVKKSASSTVPPPGTMERLADKALRSSTTSG